MKIQFIGGARTVTGSQHLLSINDKNILLECGLFQGRRQDTYEKNKNFKFDPKELMMWTEIWVRQSGEEAVIFIGGLKHTIQKSTI